MDRLIRATLPNIRVYVAETTALAEEANRRHHCYPVAAAALGRALTGALLLSATMKEKERITIRIDGDGPLGLIVADAAGGQARGYVLHPEVDLPLNNGKLPVGQAVGQGKISVSRVLYDAVPFTGSAELVSGEIAEDLTNYLYVSEQTPSSIALGVLVEPNGAISAAGGYFIQAMPDSNPVVLEYVTQTVLALPPVTKLLSDGKTLEDIVAAIAGDLPFTIHDEQPLSFQCLCSRERALELVNTLNDTELDEMIKEGTAEIRCHFCNDVYQLTQAEMQAVKTGRQA